MLVMIISIPVPIYNHFYAGRANSGKIQTFRGIPLFDALIQKEPPHPGAQNFVTEN